MATMILSNKGIDRFTISTCPMVIGSNDPGKTAIFKILELVDFYSSFAFLRASSNSVLKITSQNRLLTPNPASGCT